MRARCLVGALLLAACGPRPGEEQLLLLEFRQNGLDTVALNEELAFFFSQELDPSSVTSDSLCILDAEGRPVRGERRVRRESLTFLPELPRRADLSDGAFVPDATYTVVLGGFPRLDGIRAQSGTLLSATLKLEFRTATIGKSPLFLSPFVAPFPLRCRGKGSNPVVVDDGRIVLEAREPIDPSQVPGAHFELRRENTPVRATLELVRNEREYAELELVPDPADSAGRRFEPGTYRLVLRNDLRTLGGRALEPAWRSEFLTLIVPNRRQRVTFWAERAPEVPGDCDGTALPTADGQGLTVRYPAAAGSGAAGDVTLVSDAFERDLHAARLRVPCTTVDLSARSGPLLLRSQGALEVAGTLVRRSPTSGARPSVLAQELREFADSLSDAPAGALERPALTAWLTHLLASGEDWTVLVAGGDLRVPAGGSIQVDGPLVLVAGGWIRVVGQVSAQGDLWRTSEGAGGFASHAPARILPFRLDPPAINPLVMPFRAGFTTRLQPGAIVGSEPRVVPLATSKGWRVQAEFEEATSATLRLTVRLDVWPGPREPWLVPESGLELASDTDD
ncbi:MAG: hypothetical protein ABL998_06920 [Planctomycetota bacterium]